MCVISSPSSIFVKNVLTLQKLTFETKRVSIRQKSAVELADCFLSMLHIFLIKTLNTCSTLHRPPDQVYDKNMVLQKNYSGFHEQFIGHLVKRNYLMISLPFSYCKCDGKRLIPCALAFLGHHCSMPWASKFGL